jgi:pilus assembly protein CpaB
MNRRIVLVVIALVLTVAGMGSVYAYASQADKRATAGQELVTVLVATSRIPAGTAVGKVDALVKEQQMPAAIAPAGALSSLPSDKTRVMRQDVLLGETLLSEMFSDRSTAAQSATLLQLPPGKVAIGVELDDKQQVGRFVRPGDFVAVFATSDWNKDQAKTKLLLRKVQVLSVSTTSNKAELPKGPAKNEQNAPTTVLTLAVDLTQGAALVHAAEVGAVSFALEDARSRTTGTDAPVGNTQVFGMTP